jgi:tellurite resistance protein TerC
MVIIWILFIGLIFLILAIDLGVFHKNDQVISIKHSLYWTSLWISLALLFSIPVYFLYQNNTGNIDITNISPSGAVIKFITGYIIEESLSLDNIFVIALIFSFFQIPLQFQHRILFWGILGAIILRGIIILLGASLLRHFEWIGYLFGLLLLYSAFKMLHTKHENHDFKQSSAIKLLSKIFPISWEPHYDKFIVILNGKKTATVALACLVVVEFSDVLFAADSIPAIFAVTTDPFLVFSSNIFAILGLRTLYFFLAGILDKFYYLKYSLIFILAYVGIKMLLADLYEFPAVLSLILILVSLTGGIMVSFVKKRNSTEIKPV